jgi:probable HAF family extracellular repeat protein
MRSSSSCSSLASKFNFGVLRLHRIFFSFVLIVAIAQPSSGQSLLWLTDLGGGYNNDIGIIGVKQYDINNKGQVAGSTVVDGSERAFLWLPSPDFGLPAGMNVLGSLGYIGSRASGINERGEVVGLTTIGATGLVHAFLWLPKPAYGLPAGMNDLGSPPGFGFSEAWDINNKGEIAGQGRATFGPNRAAIWLPVPSYGYGQGWTILSSLAGGGSDDCAYAINDNGRVVGYSYDAGGSQAVRWEDGLPLRLGASGGYYSAAYDINNKDEIVGWYSDSNYRAHSFLWLPKGAYGYQAGLTDIGTVPGGVETYALGINDRGQIVGEVVYGNSSLRPFLWQNGDIRDINNLLAQDTGWLLGYAYGINESGQLAGLGLHNGKFSPYVPTPVAAPVPAYGGNMPGGLVTTTLVYGRADSVTAAVLTGPNQPDIPVLGLALVDAFSLRATFDLEGHVPGARNVVLTLAGGGTVTMPVPFTVQKDGEPQITVELVGGIKGFLDGVYQDFIRRGRETKYQLVVSNQGNVDAVWIPVWITLSGLPQDATIDVSDIGLKALPPIAGLSVDWNSYDPVARHDDKVMIPVLIPRLPVGTSRMLQIRISIPATSNFGGRVALDAWPSPMYHEAFPRGVLPDVADCLTDLAKLAYANSTGKSPNQADFQAAAAASIAQFQTLVDATYLNIDANGPLTSLTHLLHEIVLLTPQGKTLNSKALINGVSYALAHSGVLDCFQQEMLKSTSPLVTGAIDPNAVAGPLCYVDPNGNNWVSGAPMPFTVYFGNLATGPNGLPPAPAQEVGVETVLQADSLDLTRLDLNGLSLEYPTGSPAVPFSTVSMRIGGNFTSPSATTTLHPGISQFGTLVQLPRPDRPDLPNGTMDVRAQASLDLDTAQLKWHFGTDDPSGFLVAAAGGSVSFTVPWKPGLLTGAVARLKTSIFFDGNLGPDPDKPPSTYLLDVTKPSSRVLELPAIQTSSSFLISWTGTDVGSGLNTFDISVSEDGLSWKVWLSRIPASKPRQARFVGQPGKRYFFRARTEDHVGNREPEHTQSDAYTSVASSAPLVSVSGNIVLQRCANSAQVMTFELRPIDGTAPITLTQTLSAEGEFQLYDIPAGTYTLSVKGSKWLRKSISVRAPRSIVTNILLTLRGGDANGDNEVSQLDLDIYNRAKDSRPGDEHWNPQADLNCDGEVTTLDYDLIKHNVGRHGG